MDTNDRHVIDGLFDRLRQVDAQAPARDAAAERHIRQQVEQLPAAPYYMAQAIVVQEQALTAAQQRVEQLEQELAARPAAGGFLGGLFGGGARPAPAAPATPAGRSRLPVTAPAYGQGPMGGGGFMAGAMQTALGVAGGMLVASAITSAFTGGEAQAAEPAPFGEEPPPDEGVPDDGMADAGFDDESW